MNATKTFKTTQFSSPADAYQHAEASGLEAILYAGKAMAAPKAMVEAMALGGHEFAHLIMDRGTGRIMTIPVN